MVGKDEGRYLVKNSREEATMKFVYSDGGRSKYFKAKNVGDCVTRAICNATGLDYKKVYDDLSAMQKKCKTKWRSSSSARNGINKSVIKKYIASLGWVWHSTCGVGKGVQMHFNENELPSGNIIVSVSKHLVNVKDGVIYDTYNSADCYKEIYGNETDRAVYGYWTEGKREERKKVMTQEEAIKHLQEMAVWADGESLEALNMALKALEKK